MKDIPTYDINWSLLLILLRKHYGNITKLSKVVGAEPSHLNRLIREEVKQPKFNTGMTLLDIGSDHIPRNEFKSILKGVQK